MTPELAARTYALPASDPVRAKLESPFFGRLLPRLLHEAGGGRVLDLGCGRRAPSWATALLPGLPPLREAIGRLLGGDESSTPLEALTAPLPPSRPGPRRGCTTLWPIVGASSCPTSVAGPPASRAQSGGWRAGQGEASATA